MANNRRNNELTEVVQAIREMAEALLQQGNNGGNGGNNGGHMETQGLIEFRRNKPSQFAGEYGLRKLNFG
ncbi:hypothetical protein Fmac_031504 [Flemingia macrophylla]|uniref:Uncharacterized protein n=1 Tax=Flemingia macrophylla TaxID=520843 RepID=A0ABD1L2N2_9FABA